MPLRGSKLKPESDLKDTLAELKEAKKGVRLTGGEIADVTHTLEMIDSVTHEPSNREIADLIRALHEKIDRLELREAELKEKQSKTTKELIYTGKQLACGGIAGAVARTSVAPFDRVKILMQTQHLLLKEQKYTGVLQTWKAIWKEEGILKLWKGNATNVFRVIPYSATQFASYDFYKHWISPKDKKQTTIQRLTAGALAGMTATTLTHPLDVIRLRLAVSKELRGASDAFKSIISERGLISLFKGYTPTLLSLAPFIGINFATFDTLKTWVYPDKTQPTSTIVILGLGASAGLFAQTCCYPLDTVRRRMQLKGTNYKNTLDAFKTIYNKEGPKGFYRGMVANAIKILPNNAIRFAIFDLLKDYFGVQRSSEGGGGGG